MSCVGRSLPMPERASAFDCPRSGFLRSWIPPTLLLSLTALITNACAAALTDGDTVQRINTTGDMQTAFRIRSDFDADLNSTEGWAANLNEPAVVFAEQPFRLRFELEASAQSGPRQYQLQYRRNAAAWRPVLAEDFPLPEKIVELELDSAHPPDDATWPTMPADAAAWQHSGESDDAYWTLSAQHQVISTRFSPRIEWQPNELGVRLRQPESDQPGVQVIIDYASADDYRALRFEGSDQLILVEVQSGQTSILHEVDAKLEPGEWLDLAVAHEHGQWLLELNEHEIDLTGYLPDAPENMQLGFVMPADTSLDIQSVVVEAESQTPPVSIIRSAYRHGEPTRNILSVSNQPFTGGAGINFAEQTPQWNAQSGHSEWSFPLVIRRFSDQADMNEHGDRFEFRLIDSAGQAPAAEQVAAVELVVPEGLLGGTFVETPMRLGPWQSTTGDLYFALEPSETWNRMMVLKSSDFGKSWREVDGSNRPDTGDLEGVGTVFDGQRIHMLHQTSDQVLYHAFNTSDHPTHPDAWVVRDEIVAAPEAPPTQVADLVMRPDGRLLAVYADGNLLRTSIRTPAGTWLPDQVINQPEGKTLSGPSMVLGRDSVVHLAYTAGDGSAWYRSISSQGQLSRAVEIATNLATGEEDIGSILPLMFNQSSGSLELLIRAADGYLYHHRLNADQSWSEPVPIAEHRVVQNAVDSDQAGADAILFGDQIHVLLIDDATRGIMHSYNSGSKWHPAVPLIGNINAQWVRGSQIRTAADDFAYGFVYDAGSNGGSGMNRFGSIVLTKR